MNYSTPVIIVGGCGTFGLSTAWYLARAGYTDIQCLDRWPVPSKSSAGYDRNKIIRTEYGNPTYSVLSQEAIDLWRDPLFEDVFFQSGWIFGTDGEVSGNRAVNFDKAYSNTRNLGNPSQIIDFPNWDAVVSAFPVLAHPSHSDGKARFRGLFNGNAGWVKSMEAMAIVKRECESLGVKFETGVHGTVVALLREGSESETVTGVKTEDGKEWVAEKVVLAAGSYSDTLLDFEGQLIATGYCVSHVKMTEEQYQRYKHIPVINISRRGYSFPPNEDRIFKICNLDTSFTYYDHPLNTNHTWGPVSIPRDHAYNPTDRQPNEALEVTRRFMQYILPEFGDAEIESSNLCWDMESHDHNWLITPYPSSPTSLLIATAGSGHSFKNLVNVGKYVVQALEGKLDEAHRETWKWRPERVGKDPESEERASRYRMALEKASGWKH